MQNPPAKNLRQAHSLFSFTLDSFIAVREFSAKLSEPCSRGAVSPCATPTPRHSEAATPSWWLLCRTGDETFPKTSQIHRPTDVPARLAQSAALDFSHSAWADAGQNRSRTRPGNSASLCEFFCWIRQVREHRTVVAIESGARAGFETSSFGVQARARSRLWRRIFFIHRQKPGSFRPGVGYRTRRSFHRTARAFQSSARSLEDQRVRSIA